MGKIKGIPIVLLDKIEVGKDPLGKTIYEDQKITVENVIVAPTSADDITTQINLTGRKAVYTLGIPKEDTHDWENKEVIFFGKRWRTFGIPLEGIEDLIPLEWNKKVMVERIE
ncbi:hypothetical protein [Facklamia sp. 7083-14-GEN3]|uniref:hypothetical protein n=1 Tax=Facklamia sp. 7083-14-GEN3 TaxID=2973478 RepID=UPI00215B7A8D|nr:hypothetical protein [Facklamia sp. 7083-14-GEN3]MCR8969276.1 hypothetical protein [Facklamia sp. 7083-14-GEN3]